MATVKRARIQSNYWLSILQPIQLLSRLPYEQDPFVFSSGVVVEVDGGGVAVAEVDGVADRLGDFGGEGHLHAAFLDAVLVGAAAAHVGRVGEDAPGVVLELVPLLDEIVAAVVADLHDMFTMRQRNLVEVRGIDNQLPPIGDDRF